MFVFTQILKPLFRVAIALCFVLITVLVLTVNLGKEEHSHEQPSIISIEVKEFFDMKSGG